LIIINSLFNLCKAPPLLTSSRRSISIILIVRQITKNNHYHSTQTLLRPLPYNSLILCQFYYLIYSKPDPSLSHSHYTIRRQYCTTNNGDSSLLPKPKSKYTSISIRTYLFYINYFNLILILIFNLPKAPPLLEPSLRPVSRKLTVQQITTKKSLPLNADVVTPPL
jgi:hypothetical protein